ncbi:MAG: anaerobic ribonucleoside-triphosphate reductase, partial [Bacteroidales bacterium]|nr:anaerobic ribonucleoside-triphosphate reductase [Bacteroidales bacterium]
MSNTQINIVKRDGKSEIFSVEKIKNAIRKAFLSVGAVATEEDLVTILSRIRIRSGMSVEEIQNQVETALMAERYYAVAKSYMLYRQSHNEDRDVRDRLEFMMNYCNEGNAATNSKYDANANVENKNIATLIGEIPKAGFIRLNRRMLTDRIKEMYGKELSDKYLRLLTTHFIYKNDETSLANYCASITMYPWLLDGTLALGGNSKRPTNLKAFCGGFVNLVFIVSSMLSGACATPEFLMYMSYFLEQEYGQDYYLRADEVVDLSAKRRTIDKTITDCFEQIVYSINQPTGARNFQAVFWNISYYDRYYFESLFSEFRFPDGSRPHWESLSWLQKRFMKWFNAERLKTPLTFPVETMALLTENNDCKDKEWGDFTAQMYAEGHSFFTYMSDNADSLSSCCRLRNEIQDNGFSYTLGAGGVSTGSKSVLTINVNRCIQYAVKNNIDYLVYLEEVCDLVHKVQLAYNENLKVLQEKGMLPLFTHGYINIGRQYLTVGINGMVEAAEFLGIEINDNPKYVEFVQSVLGTVEKLNKGYRAPGVMFNCEMIPAENVGVKHAKWDREDGYFVPRDCYNSYFYIVEDDSLT